MDSGDVSQTCKQSGHDQRCSPEKLGRRLKQDLDKDLQLHRILSLLY